MPTPSETNPIHPGWVRATAILLRGLERLETAGIPQTDEKPDAANVGR